MKYRLDFRMTNGDIQWVTMEGSALSIIHGKLKGLLSNDWIALQGDNDEGRVTMLNRSQIVCIVIYPEGGSSG